MRAVKYRHFHNGGKGWVIAALLAFKLLKRQSDILFRFQDPSVIFLYTAQTMASKCKRRHPEIGEKWWAEDGSVHHLEIRWKVVKVSSLEPCLYTIVEGPWHLHSIYRPEMAVSKVNNGAPYWCNVTGYVTPISPSASISTSQLSLF